MFITKKNEYALLQFKRDYSSPDDKAGKQKFQKIIFYELNKNGSHTNGTTVEEMLRVSIERLKDLNSRFECKENIKAIASAKEALKLLNQRTKNRKARGVEGKHML